MLPVDQPTFSTTDKGPPLGGDISGSSRPFEPILEPFSLVAPRLGHSPVEIISPGIDPHEFSPKMPVIQEGSILTKRTYPTRVFPPQPAPSDGGIIVKS